MKKIITLMLSVAMAGAAQAQTISPKVASQKAAGIFHASNAARGVKTKAAIEPQLALASTVNGDTCFYVFNNPQGGYAIIGGDATAKEVLAIVGSGSFDFSKISPAAQDMLLDYALSIYSAKKNAAGTMLKAGKSLGADIQPLCPVQWDQSAPWDQDIPKLPTNMPGKFMRNGEDVGGQTAAVGCVAVAASQVLYSLSTKFSMPTHVVKDISKTLDFVVNQGTEDVPVAKTPLLSFPKSETINWKDMTNADGKSASRLMLLMGLVSNMGYGVESGATSDVLAAGFRSDLGLSCKYEQQGETSDAAWEQKVYTELRTGRPVIYGASSKYIGSGGHEFIIDGYESSNDLFHVNWGWGGSGDDYFALTASSATPLKGGAAWGSKTDSISGGYGSWMLPGKQGTGATDGDYRGEHEMVYQIVFQPTASAAGASISSDDEESEAKAMMPMKHAETPSYVTISTSKKMKITFDGDGAMNTGNDIDMVWGVELIPCNEDGTEIEDADGLLLAEDGQNSMSQMFGAGSYKTSYTIDLSEYDWGSSEDAIPYGMYTVTPCMFYDNDNDEDYVSDEDFSYVDMPEGWQAPRVNFVCPTAISAVNADNDATANTASKLIKDGKLIIVKNGKTYNVAGQEIQSIK